MKSSPTIVKHGKYFGDVPSQSSLPATSARGITSRTCHTEAGVLTASLLGEQLKLIINPEMVINDDLYVLSPSTTSMSAMRKKTRMLNV